MKPFPKVENIHVVAIPVPDFPDLITVNISIVGKGPVTLIDTGPKIPGLLECIQKQVKLVGFNMKDVERIIITHGHVDHFGLAASLCKTTGPAVECFIHTEDKWRVSGESIKEEIGSEEMDNLAAMVDMPQGVLKKVREHFLFFKEFCDPIDGVSTMEDGDEFIGDGYHLRVIHTPGHSPGSCCLYEVKQKILFSGDHIIKHITPNPLVALKRDRLRDPNYQSLKAYMNSLDKLTGLDVRLVFPGHGEFIEDLPAIISSYMVHHRQRMDLVWNALKQKSRPLYHLIDDVFPNVPEGQVFLAISEILVHTERLVNEGRAELADPGPPALYRAL